MENAVYAIKLTTITIAVFAVFGNALVSHVIVRVKTMKTSMNYIILNLAILDAITGFITIYHAFTFDYLGVLAGPPVLQRAYNQSSLLAEVLCKIESSYWLPVSISPLLLTIMAYERFKAVVHPYSRRDGNVVKTRLKWLLPLAWVVGTCTVIAYIPFVKYDVEILLCEHLDKEYYVYLFVLNVVWIVLQNIIPSVAMVIFYSRVVCALRKPGTNVLGLQAEAERARHKARKKVIWIAITVTLVFYIFCGVPQVLWVFAVVNPTLRLMDDFSRLLLAMNSAFNPFLYFIFMQSFRDGFRRLFMPTSHNNSVEVINDLHARPVHLNLGKMSKSDEHEQNANGPELLALKVK